jgi:hypothetical protein
VGKVLGRQVYMKRLKFFFYGLALNFEGEFRFGIDSNILI